MGDTKNVSDIIDAIGVMSSSINSQFELWVTISFAVIIASYVAGHQLPRPLKHLIASLYVSVSLLLLLMLASAVRFGGTYAEAGLYGDADFLTYSIIFLRLFVWVLGTVAALVFIYKGNQGKNNIS